MADDAWEATMKLKTLVGSFAAVTAMAACSAAGGKSTFHGSTGGSGGSGGGTGGTGTGATGGGGSGGSGGQIIVGGSGGGSGSGGDAGVCKSVPEETKPAGLQPADIIWAIDTSCSMTEEVPSVQDNMNAFSQQIIQSGIDVHVILIAAYPNGLLSGGLGICMQPPLGKAGGCPSTTPGSDNNLPTFFHDHNPPLGVQSTNGLNAIIKSFKNYDPLLRAGASHWVVGVTDDDASDPPYGGLSPSAGADKFIADYKALSPKLADFKMSGITALSKCANAASIGAHWQYVIQKTGGLSADICKCAPGQTQQCSQAFQTIFTQLAQKIIQASKPLDCQWPIPAPPPGQSLEPGKVNVQFTDNSTGKTTMLYHVQDKAHCDPQKGGWYYDSDLNPTQVISCPASCTTIKAATDAKVDVLFGCKTQAPPVQ
jgi:hypothetical protein